MEIIVSHEITDLDGLAAMIAAQKIHQKAVPVFTGRKHRLVRNFMALYRDEFKVLNISDINIDEITKVIMVDTSQIDRLGPLTDKLNWEKTEVIVYDHHLHEKNSLFDLDLSQEVGSATTILVNRIIRENIHLNPIEATICALGIYADTGKFTNLNTTPEDLTALAHLLKSKANMKIINEFLRDKLNSRQKEVYDLLLNNREDIQIDGIEITVFNLQHDQYVAGLNNVIEKIKAVHNLPVVFIIVEMEGKAVVIGRSSDEAVDAGKICTELGGGGHSGAASAQLDLSLKQTLNKVKKIFKRKIQPVKRAKDIMTAAVCSVEPDTKISRAEEIMNRAGHNGLVVCKNGEVAGIFSRRDLDKVKGHNLMHAPIKAYMSRNVIKIDPETPVSKARELMVKYNIGRLPVVIDNKLKGIVTRSDIIGSYYETEAPYKYQNRYGNSMVEIKPEIINISAKIDFLEDKTIKILKKIGELALSEGNQIYLIGGKVRDLLLKRENRDLDFVVEGDLEKLSAEIADELNGKWSYNSHFETANIKLQEFNLDLANTRREYYPSPGALPEIEKSDILEDLFRRDYTVNALALDLLPDSWGNLLDFFQGRIDLKNRKLRVLHRFSFLDDPTRIIRGIRLALTLNFDFEQETKELAREALSSGEFRELSYSRVYRELKLLFKNKVNNNLITMFNELPVFNLIDYNLKIGQKRTEELKRLENYLDYFSKNDYNIKQWLLRMAVIIQDIPLEKLKLLDMTNYEQEIFSFIKNIEKKNYLQNDDLIARVKELEKMSPEKIIIVLVKTNDKKIERDIKNYLEKFKDIQLYINGNDLLKIGMKPGPKIKTILDEVLEEKIKGNLNSKKEELSFAKKLLKKINRVE